MSAYKDVLVFPSNSIRNLNKKPVLSILTHTKIEPVQTCFDADDKLEKLQKIKDAMEKLKAAREDQADITYLKSKQYTANVWSYNLRNAKMHDKLIRSRSL